MATAPVRPAACLVCSARTDKFSVPQFRCSYCLVATYCSQAHEELDRVRHTPRCHSEVCIIAYEPRVYSIDSWKPVQRVIELLDKLYVYEINYKTGAARVMPNRPAGHLLQQEFLGNVVVGIHKA